MPSKPCHNALFKEKILSGKNGHAKARTDVGTRSNDKGRTQDMCNPTKFGLFSFNSGFWDHHLQPVRILEASPAHGGWSWG